MSESEEPEPGTVRKVLRTVSPSPKGHVDPEMNVIGLGIAAGILLLLLPLLPFLLIVYVFVRVAEALGNRS